jgi:exonuclease VII small subunit
MVEEVVKHFELGEQASNDLRRAIQQTEARLKDQPVEEPVPKEPQT